MIQAAVIGKTGNHLINTMGLGVSCMSVHVVVPIERYLPGAGVGVAHAFSSSRLRSASNLRRSLGDWRSRVNRGGQTIPFLGIMLKIALI